MNSLILCTLFVFGFQASYALPEQCSTEDNLNDEEVATAIIDVINRIKSNHLDVESIFLKQGNTELVNDYTEKLLSGQSLPPKADGIDMSAALKKTVARFSACLNLDDIEYYKQAEKKDEFSPSKLPMSKSRRRVFCSLGSLYSAAESRLKEESTKKSRFSLFGRGEKKQVPILQKNIDDYFVNFAPMAFIKGGGGPNILLKYMSQKDAWRQFLLDLFKVCSAITPIYEAMDWIAEHIEEGVFRIPGNSNVLKAYGEAILDGKSPDLSQEVNVNNVAGGLKLALAKVFEGKIGSMKNQTFLDIKDEQEKYQYVENLCRSLPLFHREVLCKLRGLLEAIIENQESKMTWPTLTTCIAPNIIQDDEKVDMANFGVATLVKQALFERVVKQCGSCNRNL